MKSILSLFLLSLFFIQLSAAQRKSQINEGWDFRIDNVEGWRHLDLPHDWSIEGAISPDNAMGNDGGYYPDGIGYYRKNLYISSSDKNRCLGLYFEGSYMNTVVYLNGDSIGCHGYGYTSFFVDITPYVRYDQYNELMVKVDNSKQKNSRWYTGSGLFRNVWLYNTDPVHIKLWSTFITTPEVSPAVAKVNVASTIYNESTEERTLVVRTELETGDSVEQSLTIGAGETCDINSDLTINSPKLWDIDHPNLYKATVSIVADGKVIDQEVQNFGVRTIQYTADRGFLLNGKQMTIYGGCIHHDNGILGAASYYRAEERKVELMKNAGFNCVRTSHNPVSEAFLDACDRLGLMVVDESFDNWRTSKTQYDYSLLIDSCWQQDISAMVMRDRNHPSIISWSIGNEIIERKEIQIISTAKKLGNLCRQLDPTRPVTEAMAAWDSDWEIYDPLAEQHEVIGYNYMLHKAPSDHIRVPERIIWQTESYPRDAFQNWEIVNDNPYVIGDFVWTAIDYLGESGIGRYFYKGETPGEHYQGEHYPWHGAYCGDIDLTGWRKPISYYRQLLFDRDNAETIHMAVKEPSGYWGEIKETQWSVWPTWDSWTWPGWEGKEIEVEVYSKAPSVRLYLNDQLIGEQKVDRETGFKAVFKLPYQPGSLRAECDGETVSLETAGSPYALRLTPDRKSLSADGQDLSFVTVEVIDAKGNVCPNAEIELECAVSGNGSLAAFGNANLQELDSTLNPSHKTWKGRALVVVRSAKRSGSYTVRLKSINTKIKSASTAGRSIK